MHTHTSPGFPPETHAVRFPCYFSESITPFRAMVVGQRGLPIGLGTVTHRTSLRGNVTGYRVELDCGQSLTVTPHQLFEPENIIAPNHACWLKPAPAYSHFPQGAA